MYLKAYKVRLDLNIEQTISFNKLFGCYRYVYNQALERKNDLFYLSGKYEHRLETQDYVQHTVIKDPTRPYLRDYSSNILKSCLPNLEAAFTNYFRNNSGFGFPKFKKKSDNNSIKFYKNSTIMKSNLLDGKLHLTTNLKDIKFQTSDKYIKTILNNIDAISSITISKNKCNQFHASILIETDKLQNSYKQVVKEPSNNIVGLDVGILSYYTDSKGVVLENPKFLRTIESKIKYLQQQVSKKKLGSANRKKAILKLNKAYKEMTNSKEHFLHNETSKITDENQIIVLEDLKIKEMMKNHKLAKSIQELSLYEFKRQLIYKAEWKNRTVILADTFFPSSKMCSCCGKKHENLNLSVRTFNCSSCGLTLDRDLNAAKNLENYGLAVLNNETHLFDYKLKSLEEHLEKLPPKQKPKVKKANVGLGKKNKKRAVVATV